MMKWYWLGLYSIAIPILLRQVFPSNLEFMFVCLLCGALYGFIAAVTR